MSFGGSAAAVPKLKSFVTEDEIEEKKKQRQEDWEKVRKPEDPVEAPEEEIDSRCLYERLQEQRDRKEQEFTDAHALKNQVTGLDEEEAQFLDFVSDRKQEITKAREDEEHKVLLEYRDSVATSGGFVTNDSKKGEPVRKQSSTQARKSQQSLLAGAVKRKSTDTRTSAAESDAKKSKTETTEPSSGTRGQVATVGAVLPGLGAYSASSDSESSSSDSEPDTRLFNVKQKVVVQCGHSQ